MDSSPSYPENSPAHLSLIASMPKMSRRRRALPLLRGIVFGMAGGVLLGMSLFACSPGEGESDRGQSGDPYALGASPQAPAPATPVAFPRAHTGFEDAFTGRTSVSHYSASLASPDPNRTVAQLEALIRKHGGQTTYSNANTSNGSIQGTVSHDKFDAFRQAASELGLAFQSENRSTSDMRAELRRLAERKAALSRAHAGLEGQTSQLDAEANAVLHELLMRERTSVSQQLDSYAQQLSGVQVNLSISRAN